MPESPLPPEVLEHLRKADQLLRRWFLETEDRKGGELSERLNRLILEAMDLEAETHHE
jgi:hypothetical protein